MGELMASLPSNIQDHIKTITKTSGMPEDDSSYEKMAQGWVDKKNIFEKELEEQGMEEIDFLPKDDKRGAIALTYSGSLIPIGPLVDGTRKVGYNSIGVRKDVPKTILRDGAILASDLKVDQILEFEKGPVKSTSSLFKIAVCKEELALATIEEEEEKISEVTVIMTNEFIDVNNALVP